MLVTAQHVWRNRVTTTLNKMTQAVQQVENAQEI